MGFMIPLIPPAIAAGSAIVRQAALYLGKRAAEKLAKEGAMEALEVAAKKATNQGIKNMRAANKLGTNVAKKAPKKKKNFGQKVVETLAPLSKGNKKIAPAIKGNVVNRKTALGYFVGGIGATKAAESIMKGDKPKSKTPNKKPTTARGTPASNKPAAKKGLSPFEKAFSEARKDGRKTFPYKGDVYNTKLKTKVTPPTKKKKK
jgi:hypothetical protein